MTKKIFFKRLLFLLAFILMLFSISACSSAKDAINWEWTKSDMSNFLNIKATVTTEDDNSFFEVSYKNQIFKDGLDEKNVILFDLTKSVEEYQANNLNYLDYTTVINNKVNYTSLNTYDDLKGFTLEFNKTNTTSSYAVIINKEKSLDNNFIFIIQERKSSIENSSSTDDIKKMTNAIIESHKSTTPSVSSQEVVQIIGNITTIIVSQLIENGASLLATGGIGLALNLVNTIFKQLDPSPSIQDVLDKLNTMSLQLEAISSQMEKNQNQLLDDNACIKVLVDKATLTTLSTQLSNFQHNYIEPMETITIKYNNYFNSELVSMVKGSYELTGYVYKDINNKWNIKEDHLISEDDESILLNINVKEFANAKNNLEKNNNKITNGFIDALVEDFVNAAKNSSLPINLTDEELKTFVTYKLDERIMEKYFSNNRELAETMQIAFIQYANALSGTGTISESLFNIYYNRLKLMYNFMGELNPEMDSIFANFLVRTDKFCRFTANACEYAGIVDDGSIKKAYTNVLNTSTSMNENLDKLDDNYCFITNSKISSNYVNFKYKSYYGYHSRTVAGDASYHDGFTSKCVAGDNPDFSISSKTLLGTTNAVYIVERRKLLVSIGIDETTDLIDYLYKNKVMDSTNYKVYKEIHTYNNSANKLLVDDFSTRKLNTSGSSDTNMSMVCTDRGVIEGYYFKVNEKYQFTGKGDAKYWYGAVTTATALDGKTGSNLGSQMLCAWAEYYETWTFACDERWAFSDSIEGSYYFVLYQE